MKRAFVRVLALAAFFLPAAGVLGGLVYYEQAKWESTPGPYKYGEVIAMLDNGDVVAATSMDNGMAMSQIRVGVYSRELDQKWSKFVGYSGGQPRSMAVKGNSVYIAEDHGGGMPSYLIKVDADAQQQKWSMLLGGAMGYDLTIAVDPVDGTIWATWLDGTWLWLAHVRDDGGGAMKVEPDLNLGNLNLEPYSMAVTKDKVYIGCGVSTMANACLVKYDKAAHIHAESYFSLGGDENWIASLSYRSGRMFSTIAKDYNASTDRVLFIAELNLAGGPPIIKKMQVEDSGCLGGWPWHHKPGQAVVHPSVPLVFACGASTGVIRGYDLDLNEKWSIMQNGVTSPYMLGLAVGDGLYFHLYGSGSVDIGPRRQKIVHYAFDNTDTTEDKVLVAPNVLDRSVPGAKVNIMVRGDKDKVANVMIFDSVGKFLVKIDVQLDSRGTGNASWDGTALGKYVAPGVYVVTLNGKPSDGSKPLMIVNERKK